MLYVEKFILEHKDTWKELLQKEPFNLRVSEDAHYALLKYNQLESFPILEASDEKFGLAISIPMKNVGKSAYKQFKYVNKLLTKKFEFTVFFIVFKFLEDDKCFLVIERKN